MKKKLLVLAMALTMLFALAACGSEEKKETATNDSAVKVYTLEGKHNSDTTNMWKNFYLVDEDTYILTVYAVDSADSTKVTCDFYMGGNYTLDGDTLNIEIGYGYCKALNGDTPIELPVAPGEAAAMYYAMVGQTTSFTLSGSTFEPIVE